MHEGGVGLRWFYRLGPHAGTGVMWSGELFSVNFSP